LTNQQPSWHKSSNHSEHGPSLRHPSNDNDMAIENESTNQSTNNTASLNYPLTNHSIVPPQFRQSRLNNNAGQEKEDLATFNTQQQTPLASNSYHQQHFDSQSATSSNNVSHLLSLLQPTDDNNSEDSDDVIDDVTHIDDTDDQDDRECPQGHDSGCYLRNVLSNCLDKSCSQANRVQIKSNLNNNLDGGRSSHRTPNGTTDEIIQKYFKKTNENAQARQKQNESSRMNKSSQNESTIQNAAKISNVNTNNATTDPISGESYRQDNKGKTLIIKEPNTNPLLSLASIPAVLKQQGDDPSCTFSEMLHNATLRGNLQSGKFSDRGEMDDMRQCVRLCCMLKGCDLAFMLRRKCFTVQCRNKYLCEPVPARSVTFSPMLCYILVKSSAG